MSTPDGAEKIGRDLYLFRSQTDTTTCAIDAHGGYYFENRSFKVPEGVTLKFYASHGNALMDEGLQGLKLATKAFKPIEEITGGEDCHDYLLQKAWDAHTFKNEADEEFRITYERAKAFLERTDRKWQKEYIGHTFDDVASLVTIRNRWDNLCGVTIKDVIHDVRKVMPALTTFHCSFCRTCLLSPGGQDTAQRL
ncbi:putative adhesin [Roseomonas sp. CAU 1739]|uniref:putative adhesin n=1 Tax=Roseomonas sp. CAU 1739 TaxID=3140364 RepID=UPI00325C06D3